MTPILVLPAIFMDSSFIIILKNLELTGVGQFINIAPTLLIIYPIDNNAENYQKQETSQKITSFLTIMEGEGLLTFDGSKFNGLGTGSDGQIHWLKETKIMATIGINGLNFLSDFRNQKMVQQLNRSVINTNLTTKKKFCRQILISSATILIAALTAWIAWLTYKKTTVSDNFEKRLKTLELQKVSPSKLPAKKDST